MPINHEQLMAMKNLGQRYSYADREVMLYVLGIGMGADPVDERETAVFNEDTAISQSLKVVALCASVTALGAMPADLHELNLNRLVIVDGERDITLHKPPTTVARILADSTMLGVFDKGADKGAVICVQAVVKSSDEERLTTIVELWFARADGGFGGPTVGQPEPHRSVLAN